MPKFRFFKLLIFFKCITNDIEEVDNSKEQPEIQTMK
jgi:hypothetical protein